MDSNEASVRRTAIITLGLILVVALVGFVVIAVGSDRIAADTSGGFLIGLVLISLTGGAILVWGPRGKRNGGGGSD